MKYLIILVMLVLGTVAHAQKKKVVYYTYIPNYTDSLKMTVIGKHTKHKWGKKFYFIDGRGDTCLQTYDKAMYQRLTAKDTVFKGVRRLIWRD